MSHFLGEIPIPPKCKYYDLNIPFEGNYKSLGNIMEMAKRLGYDVLCLNMTLSSISSSSKSKGKGQLAPSVVPPDLSEIKALYPQLAKDFYFVTRITVEMKENDDQYKIRSVLQNNLFDIVAIKPLTEKMFHCACTEINCDIITFDMDGKLPFYFKRNPVHAAIARDIHFEICYAPMIGDTTVRRLTISNALRLVECSKGKNIIITSQAKRELDLRSPYDAMNIGHLVGLPENILPHVVGTNCRKTVIHGFTRKTAKCAIYIQKIPESDDQPHAKRQKVIE